MCAGRPRERTIAPRRPRPARVPCRPGRLPGEWPERPGFARRAPRIDPVLSSGVFGSVRSVGGVGCVGGALTTQRLLPGLSATRFHRCESFRSLGFRFVLEVI